MGISSILQSKFDAIAAALATFIGRKQCRQTVSLTRLDCRDEAFTNGTMGGKPGTMKFFAGVEQCTREFRMNH
jgi:hypothetical protein